MFTNFDDFNNSDLLDLNSNQFNILMNQELLDDVQLIRQMNSAPLPQVPVNLDFSEFIIPEVKSSFSAKSEYFIQPEQIVVSDEKC